MKLYSILGAASLAWMLGPSAKADVCTSQFQGGEGTPEITINADTIDIARGITFVVVTASDQDYKAESLCNNVMNQTIHLPYVGRLVKVVPTGQVTMSGENTWGTFEISGSASVPGKTDVFQKAFKWTGVPSFNSVDDNLGFQSEANSVCGQDITIKVDRMRSYFETDPDRRGSARVDIHNLRLQFAPVDPRDGSCVNKPEASVGPGFTNPFVSGEIVEIKSAYTNKCVDVTDFALWNGALVQQWDCAGSQNQLFRMTRSGDSMTLQALHSNQCLAIGNGSTANGASVTQVADCNSAAAKVTLGPASVFGAFTLRSANSGKCLDIDDGKNFNGQKLQQWDCVGTPWQEWWITPR